MQALHDHLGVEIREEEDGDVSDDDSDEKQIWQVDFWDGGLRKVHLLQAQAICETKEWEILRGFSLAG